MRKIRKRRVSNIYQPIQNLTFSNDIISLFQDKMDELGKSTLSIKQVTQLWENIATTHLSGRQNLSHFIVKIEHASRNDAVDIEGISKCLSSWYQPLYVPEMNDKVDVKLAQYIEEFNDLEMATTIFKNSPNNYTIGNVMFSLYFHKNKLSVKISDELIPFSDWISNIRKKEPTCDNTISEESFDYDPPYEYKHKDTNVQSYEILKNLQHILKEHSYYFEYYGIEVPDSIPDNQSLILVYSKKLINIIDSYIKLSSNVDILQDMEKKIIKLKTDILMREDEIKALKYSGMYHEDQLQEYASLLETAKNKLKDKENEIEFLKNIDVRKQSLDGIILNELQSNLEMVTKKYQQCKIDLEHEIIRGGKLEISLQTIQINLKTKIEECDRKDMEIEDLGTNVSELQREITTLRDSLRAKENEIDFLSYKDTTEELVENNNIDEKIKQEEEINKLKNSLILKDNEYTLLQYQLDEVKRTIKMKESDITALHNGLKEKEIELRDLHAELNDLHLKNESYVKLLNDRDDGVQNELKHKDSENEQLLLKISGYRTEIKHLEDTIQSIRMNYMAELSEKDKTLVDLQNNYNRLNNEQTIEKIDHQRQVKELEHQLQEYSIKLGSFERAKEKIKKLKQKIDQKNEKLCMKNRKIELLQQDLERQDKLITEQYTNGDESSFNDSGSFDNLLQELSEDQYTIEKLVEENREISSKNIIRHEQMENFKEIKYNENENLKKELNRKYIELEYVENLLYNRGQLKHSDSISNFGNYYSFFLGLLVAGGASALYIRMKSVN
eukprot:TRINITY_DN8632_c0_g1_i1.p1 TRINITY_DN8632_c0_g1~~TRINITY_DN8632_c0_g1_i1.p1  ORF type:complete len:803 (-),score=196.96 TRINITY_DN8632_c0_g1_i1:99-2453(-)